MLNEQETRIVRRLQNSGKLPKKFNPVKANSYYGVDGRTTFVVIVDRTGVRFGASTYHPADAALNLPYKPELGRNIAFGRALK